MEEPLCRAMVDLQCAHQRARNASARAGIDGLSWGILLNISDQVNCEGNPVSSACDQPCRPLISNRDRGGRRGGGGDGMRQRGTGRQCERGRAKGQRYRAASFLHVPNMAGNARFGNVIAGL